MMQVIPLYRPSLIQRIAMTIGAALAIGVATLCLVLVTVWLAPAIAQDKPAPGDGLIKVRSAYSMDETVTRLRQDISAKGIQFFQAVDQSQLAANAGIGLHRSTLLEFGNPPLGIQFLTANPFAGLDWPVRLLVTQDANGTVWAVYTDFAWIAKRHHINDRQPQFAMAAKVVESITGSVKAQ